MRAPRPLSAVTIATAATVVTSLPVFLAGSLAVAYGPDLGVGAASVGLIVAGYWAASALASTPAGRLAQRWGARTTLVAAMALSLVAMAGVAVFGSSVAGLAGGVAVAGAANALAHPPSNALIVAGVRARRSTAMGVKQAAIPLATLLAGGSIPLVVLHVGWRAAFIGAGVAAAVMVLVALLAVPRLEIARRVADRSTPFPRPLRRYLALMTVSGFFGVAQANMIGGFAVITAVERGFDAATAGAVVVIASVVGIAMRVVVGIAADRGGGASMGTVGAMLLLGAAGLVGIALGDGPVLTAGLILTLGAGWSWNGLVHAIVATRTGDRAAAATGLVQTGAYAGGAVGPLLFGAAAGVAGIGAGWMVGAVCAVIAATTALVAWRRERGLSALQ